MGERFRGGPWSWLLTTAISFVVGLLVVVLVVQVRYGSWATARHALRGDVMLSDRYEVALDRPATAQTVVFRLTNTSSDPIRVIGAQSSCSCVMATGLPLTIAPGASQTLEVRFKPKKTAQSFRESVRVFTNRPGQQVIPLAISATVGDATK